MSIVVTTPTGHIGARVVRLLLQAGVRPRLILRDPAKLDPEIRERVDIHQGDVDDSEFVLRATEGARALFWLIPGDYASEDPIGAMMRRGEVAARAVQTNGIARTVFLSSIGAEKRHGMGFIDALGQTEDRLNATGANVVHLRPGYFFTNLHMSLDALRQGVLPVTVPLDMALPWVDPRDIGDIVAARLLNSEWSGQEVQAVHGPEDLSHSDVARIVTEATGHAVQAVRISDEEERGALLEAGLNAAVADGFNAMSRGLRDDFTPENPRTVVTTTPTSLAAWAYANLRPRL
jgi:uncharacterized protein YbjT (DUF2867 family)